MKRERNDWLLEAEAGGNGETLMAARFRGYLPVVLDVETGGFNARTDEFEDMIAAGVIDPTKVTRFALQNAASVSGLLLTTQCMIADKPEEKGAGAMAGMPPGGGYPGMGM